VTVAVLVALGLAACGGSVNRSHVPAPPRAVEPVERSATPMPAGLSHVSRRGFIRRVVSDPTGRGEDAVAVAPSSREGVYVAGTVSDGPNGADDAFVASYAADSQLVSSFGRAGVAVLHVAKGSTGAVAVGVQRNADIVLATAAIVNSDDSELVVARFRPDGSLDQSFARAGVLSVTPSALHTDCVAPGDLAVDQRGGILVAGTLGCGGEGGRPLRPLLIRVRPSGELDPGFARLPQDLCDIESIALAAGGRIVIAGRRGDDDTYCDDGVHSMVLGLRANGHLDPRFGVRGEARLRFLHTRDNYPRDVLADAHGRIIVGGSADTSRGDQLAFARLTRNGAYDRTFGDDGRRTEKVGPYRDDDLDGIASTVTGGLVAVATSRPEPEIKARVVLVRLTNRGRPAASFGPHGGLVAHFGTDARAAAITRAGRGNFVAVGRISPGCEIDEPPCAAANVALIRITSPG
jgi:uncharacterized delta-60 repeat protein